MIFDFHTHTFLSDGENSPIELIRIANANGYSVIGITDHVSYSNIDFIIDAVRNALLYSHNTIPEYGKIRADEFTKDMLELYPDIHLNAKCENEIVIPEIIDGKVKQKSFIKRLIGRGKNEESSNIRKY